MTRTPAVKTIVSKGIGQTAKLRVADLYPVAGIVSIVTYIVVECILG